MDRLILDLPLRVLKLVRYRFLLFAGILPYFLGSATAVHFTSSFHLYPFLLGLSGLLLVLVGVETFNEYFDAKIGPDRVFLSPSAAEVPPYTLKIGLLAFASAFVIAVYLAFMVGPAIILFALVGFLAAGFYVAPPFLWSYRGLGELVISLAYGPLMTTGAYYLQAQKIDFNPVVASILPAFLIMSVVLINEVPDYFQDRLVGKRNIVVRIGQRKAVVLYQAILFSAFAMLGLGLVLGEFPLLSLLVFVTLPLALRNGRLAKRHYQHPQTFIPAIRGTILLYTIAMLLLTWSYLSPVEILACGSAAAVE